MAEVEYLLFCDYATIGEGGKPIICGVFDRINASAFPCAHPVMYLTARVQGTPHEVVNFRIEIGRPNGEVLQRLEPPDLVLAADGVSNLNIQFVGLTFPESGRYTVKILSGGHPLVSKSLRLTQIQPGAAPPPQQRPN